MYNVIFNFCSHWDEYRHFNNGMGKIMRVYNDYNYTTSTYKLITTMCLKCPWNKALSQSEGHLTLQDSALSQSEVPRDLPVQPLKKKMSQRLMISETHAPDRLCPIWNVLKVNGSGRHFLIQRDMIQLTNQRSKDPAHLVSRWDLHNRFWHCFFFLYTQVLEVLISHKDLSLTTWKRVKCLYPHWPHTKPEPPHPVLVHCPVHPSRLSPSSLRRDWAHRSCWLTYQVRLNSCSSTKPDESWVKRMQKYSRRTLCRLVQECITTR